MQLGLNTALQQGKYRIIRVLGQGGFGITYLAENKLLAKQVAIKEFFPKEYCGRDNTSHVTVGTENNADTVVKLKERFLKEARNIAKLNNPGIVTIYDVFEENDTAYYVMEFIDGMTLSELVKAKGALPEPLAVKYILKVASALDYIHSCNMTHFDIKPANIIVRSSDDEPVIIDFGLSKQYTAAGDATSTLMQAVSRGFSPIELYNPGSISNFSPQTDIYSLGATLLYLVTGITPRSASEILEEGLELPRNLSLEVNTAISLSMKVSRSKRPANVKEIIDMLSPLRTADDASGNNPHSATFDDSTRIFSSADSAQPNNFYSNSQRSSDNAQNYPPKQEEQNTDYPRGAEDNEMKKMSDDLNDKSSTIKFLSYALIFAVIAVIILFFVKSNSTTDEYTDYDDDAIPEEIKNSDQALYIKSLDFAVIRDGKISKRIYSSTTTFIYPHVELYNLSSKEQILGVRIYDPYDDLIADDFASDTISSEYHQESVYLNGWGNSVPGCEPGIYRVELWCNYERICEGTFEVIDR